MHEWPALRLITTIYRTRPMAKPFTCAGSSPNGPVVVPLCLHLTASYCDLGQAALPRANASAVACADLAKGTTVPSRRAPARS